MTHDRQVLELAGHAGQILLEHGADHAMQEFNKFQPVK